MAKQALILGIAGSGMAAARLALQRGWDIAFYDDQAKAVERLKECAADLSAYPCCIQNLPEALAKNFSLCVVSPGFALDHPVIQQLQATGCALISEVEWALDTLPAGVDIVAVTGTNGKTTTCHLLGHVFACAGRKSWVLGNVGVPLCDKAKDIKAGDVLVLELSSFQLELQDQLRPKVSVILNITPDHLDRYASMEEYALAKKNIYQNQSANDVCVILAEDPYLQEMSGCRARILRFSSQGKETVKLSVDYYYDAASGMLRRGDTTLLAVKDMPLKGLHNYENVLAVWASAKALGLTDSQIAKAVASFVALPHRVEWVREVKGVDYINDSKGTNIDAVKRALQGYDRPVVLILGGKDKGLDFAPLEPDMRKKVKRIVALGEMAPVIEKLWTKDFGVRRVSSMDEAVRVAAGEAAMGDIVLLSPGCSSFDMFTGYVHRGECFKKAVMAL